jgi:hypothetical protein
VAKFQILHGAEAERRWPSTRRRKMSEPQMDYNATDPHWPELIVKAIGYDGPLPMYDSRVVAAHRNLINSIEKSIEEAKKEAIKGAFPT